MPTERLAPDAILATTNLSGAVGAIQDDPDSPDGNWLTAPGSNNNTEVHVSFGSPTSNLTTGTDLQEIRAYVRKTNHSTNPTARLEVWESGSQVLAGSDSAISSTSGQSLALTWNASLLSSGDGSGVEVKVIGTTGGGNPSNRASVEVGAVEWNADFQGVNNWNDSISEGSSAGESPSAAMSFAGSVSEAANPGTSLGPSAGFARSISADASAAVALTVLAGMAAGASESAAGSDAAAAVRAASATLAQAVGASGAEVASIAITEAVTAAIQAATAQSGGIAYQESIAEGASATAAETALRAAAGSRTESVSTASSDGASAAQSGARSEGATADAAQAGGFGFEDSISESGGVQDTLSSALAASATIAEALGAQTAQAILAAIVATLPESFAAGAVEAGEVTGGGANYVDAITEAAGLSATEVGQLAINAALAQGASVEDAVAATAAYFAAAAEALGITDAALGLVSAAAGGEILDLASVIARTIETSSTAARSENLASAILLILELQAER